MGKASAPSRATQRMDFVLRGIGRRVDIYERSSIAWVRHLVCAGRPACHVAAPAPEQMGFRIQWFLILFN